MIRLDSEAKDSQFIEKSLKHIFFIQFAALVLLASAASAAPESQQYQQQFDQNRIGAENYGYGSYDNQQSSFRYTNNPWKGRVNQPSQSLKTGHSKKPSQLTNSTFSK